MNKYTSIRFRVSIAALAMCYFVPLIARAQSDNPLEMLRQYPADPSIIGADAIESAKKMLAWRIERGTTTIHWMERDIKDLENTTADLEEQMFALAQQGMGVYAFTSDTVRAQLIGRVLERLLDVRVDIAANEAIVSYLDKNLHEAEAKAKEGLYVAFKAQRDALEAKLKTLLLERERLKALHAKNAVSAAVLLTSKATFQSLEAEIAALDVDKESIERQEAAKIATPLSDARVKLLEKRAREKMAARQLDEITSAASFAPRVRKAQREIDRLRSILDIRVRRMREAEMDVAESQTFLKLIERKLKDHREHASASND